MPRKKFLVWLLFAVWLLMAHDGLPPQPHDLWQSWNWNPLIVFGLYAVLLIYGSGVAWLWQRRGVGKVVSVSRTAAFSAGLFVLFIALITPLDGLGSALFSAHMLQHNLLIFGAPPLLIGSLPAPALLAGLPRFATRSVIRFQQHAALRRVWLFLTCLPVIWFIHAGMLWLWHLPLLYEAALRNEFVHIVEHISFTGVSLLYWWSIFHTARTQTGASILSLFGMSLQGGLLGALLTFSRLPWYSAYSASVDSWGLTLLQDQQLAGILMWIPAGFVYLTAALYLMARWLNSMESHPIQRASLPADSA